MFFQYLGNKTKASVVQAFAVLFMASMLVFSASISPAAFAEEPIDPPSENTGDTEGENNNSEPETTVIDTGDAAAESDILNTANTNITDTNGTSTVDETGDVEETGDATSTEEGGEELIGGDVGTESVGDDDDDADIEVENNNDAVVENNSTTTADTGENTANNNEDTIIDTGDAYATANVVNVVNTNIFNSHGFIVFLNSFMSSDSDLDLRDRGWLEAPGDSGRCGVYECESISSLYASLYIGNNNTAEITNSVVVRSSTGGNESSGNSGDSIISTGDAYAAANVVNIVNTNIVNSNYLVLTFNNFGDWGGDIVFPAKEAFKNLFGGVNSTVCGGSSLEVTNNNEAVVENNIVTTADTGNNEASGNGGDSVIVTGDAVASTNVVNEINTNILCETSFAVVFRVHGSWAGNIFGAPDNVSWEKTPTGLEIYGDGLLGDVSEECDECGGSIEVNNNNSANIKNDIQVFALTGDNKIEGGGGNAIIETGNAYAATNIVNVANTNIIGRNWILAIINIFGDWDGDVAFGRPDLWIGASAEVANSPARIGNRIVYNFTIMNNGDADATEVRLTSLFDIHQIIPTVGNYDDDGEGMLSWVLGTIPAGGSIEVFFESEVAQSLGDGQTTITNTATIESLETDNNDSDNTDTVTILAQNGDLNSSGSSGNSRGPREPHPKFRISKINAAESDVHPGDLVDYDITLINEGLGSAYNTILTDTLRDPEGNVINEEVWDLGEVFADEEITITYTMEFNPDAEFGVYTNSAQATALSGFPDKRYGLNVKSYIAESAIEIVEAEETTEEEVFVVTVSSGDYEGSGEGEIEPEFSIGDTQQELAETNNPLLAFIGGLFTGNYSFAMFLILLAFTLFIVLLRRRIYSSED